MKLFVGLGNPGAKYAHHRHNVGFMAVERIAARHGFGPWRRKFQGLASEGEISGEKVLLLKPDTYMNESGRAAGEAARFLKIEPGDIVAFHDELDLAPGKLKVKTGGGNAGHNGLRSLSAHLGNDYVRVRIGIGHPGSKDLVHAWVLHDFSKQDADWLEPLLDAMADAAGRLAESDQPRFLTDVARLLQAEPDPAPASREPKEADDGVRRSGSSQKRAAHPTGERMSKRQSALAENLKKWLAGRGKPDA
ncbi:MAG: aminoacyl-tRNA hydrolase [Hyphomicrobiaceae bacterium]